MVGEKKFKKYSWVVFVLFLGVTAFFGYQITHIKFDYDFEKFFPQNDRETDFFFEHRARFESDNDFLLIAIENDKGTFDRAFLTKVNKFVKKLDSVEFVKYSMDITRMEERLSDPLGIVYTKPYINFETFNVQQDSTRIFNHKELINTFVASDAQSVCVFVRHDDFLSKKKSDALIHTIENLLDTYQFDHYRLAGRTVGQRYYITKMSYEMTFFVGLSAFLIVLFLLLAFRSGWGILIPQVVIFSGMIWVVGGMGLLNEPVNIILTILPSIMFVVSMSDVIHLVSRYLDALRVEESTFIAIKVAIREVGLATLLTSVTTAVGFFSLYFVKVQPIQVFGIVMGFGVIVAFVLTFLTLPILFYIFPGPKYVREKKQDHFWKKYLPVWFLNITHHRGKWLIAWGVIIAVSILGISRMTSNNFLMDDISQEEEIKKDFDFLDAKYGGVRPFELAVMISDTSKTVWDKEVLQQIDSVENYLETVYGVTLKNSLVQILKVMNRSSHAGNKAFFELPTSKRKLKSYRSVLEKFGEGKMIRAIVDTSGRIMRVNGTIPDLGNNAVTAKNKGLKRFIDEKEKVGLANYHITGTAHLLDKNMSYLSISLVKGLGISILIVALIIGFVYRSVMIMFISVVANVIPLLVIGGFMGFMGIELKISTSIIFTIAFGIAVDDTIHFLGKFKFEQMKGKGKLYALKRSYLTTGKAMILTTLILCAGFLLLIFSSFTSTYYMGLLLCITLFVALIADLTILPVLLLIFYKDKKSQLG